MGNRLDDMLRAEKKHKKQERTKKIKEKPVPVYNTKGKVITPSVLGRRKRRMTAAMVFVVLVIFLYLPGYFMHGQTVQDTAAETDASAIRLSNNILRNSPNEDFDGDGLMNGQEIERHTDPWDIDTDKDNLMDSYEAMTASSDPIRQDKNIIIDIQTRQDKEKSKSVSSPYKTQNVILWADDYQSKAKGSIVETRRGYNICGFNGYAQFPESKGKYAYKLEDGIHTLLPYRTEENAWRVQDGQVIELFDEKLESAVRLGVFSWHTYMEDSWLSKTITLILPDKGFLTAKTIMKIDADPDTSDAVIVDIKKPVFDSNDSYRFTVNTTSLDSYQYVLATLENGKECIAVSLYNKDKGEYMGIIYGHDGRGGLYVADMDTLRHAGVLHIKEKAKKIVDKEGNIVSQLYFDFSGFGFSSAAGDRISFFAESGTMDSSSSNAALQEEIMDNTSESEQVRRDTTESSTTDLNKEPQKDSATKNSPDESTDSSTYSISQTPKDESRKD